jgi:hypothetical protein
MLMQAADALSRAMPVPHVGYAAQRCQGSQLPAMRVLFPVEYVLMLVLDSGQRRTRKHTHNGVDIAI